MKQEFLTKEGQRDFKDKLNKAFRALRKNRYIAKQDFWCCQSCAWADLPEDYPRIVFYHHQDAQDIPFGEIRVAWKSDDPNFIVSVFNVVGLKASWDEDEGKRIKINYVAG